MPIGDFVNQIPAPVFLLIHLVAFLIGAYFAWRSFGAGQTTLGWAFSLFALAEISYLTYHLDWTVFLFAHTISEVLDLIAFILVFVAATRTVTASVRSGAGNAGGDHGPGRDDGDLDQQRQLHPQRPPPRRRRTGAHAGTGGERELHVHRSR